MPIEIPRDKLTIRYSRSGGPGGQNVNKVETKVEIRFHVASADWISDPVKSRLLRILGRRVNAEGEAIVVSSRFRNQQRNLEDCLQKLAQLIEEARKVPKRRVRTRPTQASKKRRREEKIRRGKRKKERRTVHHHE